MSIIARKFMAHYIDAAAPEDFDELFELFGDGVEEFTPQMSAKVDKKQNILGHTNVVISGYEKTCEVPTYYTNPGSELHSRLMSIIDDGKTLDSLKTRVVDVYLWRPKQEEGYFASMENAYIEIKSYGGDTSGVQIPFTLHYTGERQKGYFDVERKAFTPEEPEEE